jgi:hypothetical protein
MGEIMCEKGGNVPERKYQLLRWILLRVSGLS